MKMNLRNSAIKNIYMNLDLVKLKILHTKKFKTVINTSNFWIRLLMKRIGKIIQRQKIFIWKLQNIMFLVIKK